MPLRAAHFRDVVFLNTAETDVSAPTTIVQLGELPEQAPPQPINAKPFELFGAAARLIDVPFGKMPVHVELQLLMP